MPLKLFLIVFLSYIWHIKGHSQINLVLNPSFEIISNCPSSINQIQLADYWYNLSNNLNTEPCWGQLVNSCCTNTSLCGVPQLGIGAISYQYPRTGNSMCILTLYDNNLSFINLREYVKGSLVKRINLNEKICFKAYLNLSNISFYKINRFGVYFSDNYLFNTKNNCEALNIIPHIESSPLLLIDDTLNWTKVEGIYTANGSETNFIIGNFYDNLNTLAVNTLFSTDNSNSSFYYIDDVSVIPLDVKAWAGNDATLCIGDTVRLGRPQEVGLECLWYTTTNTTPFSYNSDVLFTATEPGTYTLIQKMDNCQISFDTVTVTVVEDCNDLLTLPNIFTPNGDGTNDVFSFNLKHGTLKTFAVYNRWGNIIYLMDNNSSPSGRLGGASWDGKNKSNEICNDGVYFYVLEYADIKGELKTKRGYVSLMR